MLPGIFLCYLFRKSIGYLFPSQKQRLFALGNMTVSSRVWCSETIPAGFVDASLFH